MNFSHRHFPGLDGLRAVAVFFVILHHIGMIMRWWPFQGGPDFLSLMSFQAMRLGFIGVDVFFVISGFLISGLLLEDIHGPLRVKRFYLRRAFKILPQYFTVVFFGILITIIAQPHQYPLSTYLNYFFFIQNYTPQIEILRHLWTIAVEEHFYFCLPMIYWGIWCLFKKADVRLWALLVMFLFLIALGNYGRWFDSQTIGLDPINQPPDWQWTHRRFDALVFGCLLRLVVPFLTKFKEKLRTLPVLLFVVGFELFVGAVGYGAMVQWFDYMVLYVSCGFILLSIVLGFGPLSSFLEISWIKWMGRNSYGIYIWHMMSIFFFRDIFQQTKSVWFILLYVLVTLGLGILSTQMIEQKFLNIRQKVVP